MDIYVLNKQFQKVLLIDAYTSLIWTDRYCGFGDFELMLPLTGDRGKEYLANIKTDYYLSIAQSEHTMVIDEFSIQSDIENGSMLRVAGRSLESILDRRIIFGRVLVDLPIHRGISKLLNECIIYPTGFAYDRYFAAWAEPRRIPNFEYPLPTDPDITSKPMAAEYNGNNLYTEIVNILNEYEFGFKIILSDGNKFTFTLYNGVNRSYSQTANPYVVFSPNFDNLLNSELLESSRLKKTAITVSGNDETAKLWGFSAYMLTAGGPNGTSETGLERKEDHVNVSDLSEKDEQGEYIDWAVYQRMLTERAKREFTSRNYVREFSGDADFTRMYVYGKDFFLGDIVQLETELGVEADARITEITYSSDASGDRIVPGYSVIPYVIPFGTGAPPPATNP